jgi:HPt (histidine-containing phosphotransfer) domain-containing protein
MPEKNNSKFDIKAFEDCFGGDKEFAKEIISAFLEDFSVRQDELEVSVSNKDNQSMETALHSIKGLLINIGAQDLSLLAKDIECSAAENNLNNIEEKHQKFKVEIDRLLETFKEYLAN